MRTGYNHYIRLNEAGEVVHGFSDAFEQPQDGDILVLENGPRHFHQVWPWPIVNERGQYISRWIDGQRVERSQEELDAEWSQRPPAPPTIEQRLKAIEELNLGILLGGV
ncbi:MAG: hypothetical protein C6W55_00585 [Thermobacillus sp.]|uniref:hypothetical protein n=1 Tax=Thermobacillus sp. TaxID=2108467 RepID=UPI000E3B0861|nr:hypothetical protein [Thermobacillus sp.]REK59895.1 MAG: hypothetical protein C6W55_00585 [Thermobacillus sp.]